MENNMITAKQAAAALNGNQYRNEGSHELFTRMNEANPRLVAVFGYSDNIMMLQGAECDERYGEARFTKDGLLENECDDDKCPHFAKTAKNATLVRAIWGDTGISWTYQIDIPHETFLIMEGDDVYCRGIVFSLADCAN
jgi:hypothetical protein